MTQLSPIPPDQLPVALEIFARGVAGDALASAAFARIRATLHHPTDEDRLMRAMFDLAGHFGIATIDEEPARAFSWDGQAIRTRSEPCVLFHEIAHWQVAPPERRAMIDFGLGAGPESGRKDEADRARTADEDRRTAEEGEASLLGILWEARFDGPAIEAFLEQNWLERYESEGTHRLFADTIAALHARGLIDDEGQPVVP